MTDDDEVERHISVDIESIIGEHESNIIVQVLVSMSANFRMQYPDLPSEVIHALSVQMLVDFLVKFGHWNMGEDGVQIVNSSITEHKEKEGTKH